MVENEVIKMEEIKLLGKVIIKGVIEAKTGLRIGGSTVGLDIGGVDNPVIKDAEGNGKLLDYHAEKLGMLLGIGRKEGGMGAKTSQIRNVFDRVKRMEYDEYKVPLLRAKLFYVAGRHSEMSPLKDILSDALKLIDEKEKFDRFKDFFEAIVAYHKYYGGE